MSGSKLQIERRAGVAVVTLSDPPVNALGTGMIRALHDALDAIEADGDVRVLHVRSAGKVFCAGADLAEMRANLAAPDSLDAQIAAVRDIQGVLRRIETQPMATLAEIGGAAMGGGLELALACDFRVVANTAKLGLPETSLGLIPGAGGTQRLPALCGFAVARRLILGAEIVDGVTAAALGLAHWAMAAADLATFAAALAERLAARPRSALAAAKSCVAAGADPARDGYAEELAATRRLLSEPKTRARVEAFLAGRRS